MFNLPKPKNDLYFNRYVKLIQYVIDNPNNDSTYTENHHIFPSSMGGPDTKENKIKLSARQHFIAHWFLWKAYKNNQMCHGFWAMQKQSKNKNRYTKINSKTYQKLKEERSKIVSLQMSTKNPSSNPKTKKIRSLARKNKTWEQIFGHEKAKQLKLKMSTRIVSKETRDKMSKSQIGHKMHPNQSKAIIESNKRRPTTIQHAIEATKVKCYCEGTIFNSVTEAEKHYKSIGQKFNLHKRLSNPKWTNFYRIQL